MIINLNNILYAVSYALDCVEHDVVGVTTNHGKRVAYIAVALGKQARMRKEELIELAGTAIMHDCALTEALVELKKNVSNQKMTDEEQKVQQSQEDSRIDGDVSKEEQNTKLLAAHCWLGEKNLKYLQFHTDIDGSILYHHENADGTGPFHKTLEETPLQAQLIHIADQIDARWNLNTMTEEKYQDMVKWIEESPHFSRECKDMFFAAMDYDTLQNMQKDQVDDLLYQQVMQQDVEFSNEELIELAAVFARIIDYKSEFTRSHSMEIAKKALQMAEYYGFDEEKATKLYCAGALHDIGKLVTDRDILEKPDKLTDIEYAHIQNHAYETYQILSKIKGMEDITQWASNHHEKLDGTGYPFGKTAEQLSHEDRLLCCLDIYQALTEKRPYKDGFPHEKAIAIMNSLVEKNQLDGTIVGEIDQVMSHHMAVSNHRVDKAIVSLYD